MRVALLARRFDPAGGGTERDLMVTAECLRRAGHAVTIYAAEVRGSQQPWSVRHVGSVGMGRTASLLSFAWWSAAAARRHGADLVLSFARVIGADILRSGGGAHLSYLCAARRWRGRAGAAAMRLSPYHRAQIMIERKGFRWAGLRRAVAVSGLVRDDLIAQFGIDPRKAVTLYNGVDLERFRPMADKAARARLRRRLGLPGEGPVVIFVGDGFARKGLGCLIEAWPRVRGEPWLMVVGHDRKATAYRRRARELGVRSRVVLLGRRPDVEVLFHAADALALPSMFEPFGNVVMEAMASGLPVLTSAQTGASELLPAPARHLIVQDPRVISDLAGKLGDLIEASNAGWGKVARATAEGFTWERYAEGLNELISAAM